MFSLRYGLFCVMSVLTQEKVESEANLQAAHPHALRGIVTGLSRSELKETKLDIFPTNEIVLPREDGSFILWNLLEGYSYRVFISTPTHRFSIYRVEVAPSGIRIVVNNGTYSTFYESRGDSTTLHNILVPFQPESRISYANETPLWDPLSFLRQPLVLLMLVSLGITYIIPKLVSEEEMKASLDEIRQRAQG